MKETLEKLKNLVDSHEKLIEAEKQLNTLNNSQFVAKPFSRAEIPAEELKKAKAKDNNKLHPAVIVITIVAALAYIAFFMCDYFLQLGYVFKADEPIDALKIAIVVIALLCYTGVTFFVLRLIFKNKKAKNNQKGSNVKNLEAKYKEKYKNHIKNLEDTFNRTKPLKIAQLQQELEQLKKAIAEQDVVEEKYNTRKMVTHIYCLLKDGYETDLQNACKDAFNRNQIDESLKLKWCSALKTPATIDELEQLGKDVLNHFSKNVELLGNDALADIEDENSNILFYVQMMPLIGTLSPEILNIDTSEKFKEFFQEIKIVYAFYSQQEEIFKIYNETYKPILMSKHFDV